MGFQFHMLNALSEHDDATGVAFFAGRRKVEEEPAPYPDPALIISLEPETTKEYRVIEEHDIHALAVTVRRLKHKILDGFGSPPVPDSESSYEQPEQGSESHVVWDPRTLLMSGDQD